MRVEDQTLSKRFFIVDIRRYLQAAVQRQFFEDVMHMTLDCVQLDAEALGDCLIAQAVRNQSDDFTLTRRHPHCIGQFPFPLPKRIVDNMGEKRFCQQGREDLLPARYIPDCCEDFPCSRIYKDKAGGTGLDELDDVHLRRDETHPDNFGLRQILGQMCHDPQAVDIP